MSELSIFTVDVSRGSTHDGPGLRTAVFTKGCPLDCRWCQNPESKNVKQEIWFDGTKCIGCLECITACTNSALETDESGIKILRDKCVGCGNCAEACPAKALCKTGTAWTLSELLREVKKDEIYYSEFGGGVTVSGGEPLYYDDFLVEFFRSLKMHGIHTAFDTCGQSGEDKLMKVVKNVDAVLYDIKLMDNSKHEELTGVGNKMIMANLLTVAQFIRQAQKTEDQKKLLWIRTPLIPNDTATEDNISQIAAFINENILDVTDRWDLCTFNTACTAKYKKMQLPWHYNGATGMTQNQVDKLILAALSQGIPEEKLNVTGIIRQE